MAAPGVGVKVEEVPMDYVGSQPNRPAPRPATTGSARDGSAGPTVVMVQEPASQPGLKPAGSRLALLLHVLQCACAIISFSLMVSSSNFSDIKAFSFLVAIGVIIFLWSLVMVVAELISLTSSRELYRRYALTVRFTISGVLAFLAFGAGCAAAAITSQVCGASTGGGCSKPQAAVTFMFFAWGLLLPVWAMAGLELALDYGRRPQFVSRI